MIVTCYKRHSADCKHKADRDYAKCGCRMMLEGSANTPAEIQAVASVFPGFSKQGRFRLSADTRNRADAADKARLIERRALDILSGVTSPADSMTVAKAAEVFMAAKRNAGLEEPAIQKLQKTTDRIKQFCDSDRITNLRDVNHLNLISSAPVLLLQR
jgi:hypothetical protein